MVHVAKPSAQCRSWSRTSGRRLCVGCQLLRLQASSSFSALGGQGVGVGGGGAGKTVGEDRGMCMCIHWRSTSWTNRLVGGPQVGPEISGEWRTLLISKRLTTVRCLWNKHVNAVCVQRS